MNYEPLILLTGLGIVGYATFHGHRWGKDCFLCKYRGIAFLGSSVALGLYLAIQEED